MSRKGRAVAFGAGTVLNALATGTGSAFAIDAETEAAVVLRDEGDDDADGSGNGGVTVTGEVDDAPDADTRLIERCVELAVAAYDDGETRGGHVRTRSDVPMAAGLKSSSAAANATVLATLDALGVDVVAASDPADDATLPDDADAGVVSRVTACRLGVRAARETGVSVTGAFDDASASMLGGVTVTDNAEDALLARAEVEWDALVWTPDERAFTADADVSRCEAVAPMADLVAELALDGRYAQAMTVNGLAFSAALDFPTDPAVEAMPHAAGVSLSGTGPSVVAVGNRDALDPVRDLWADRPGTTRLLTTRTDGARVL